MAKTPEVLLQSERHEIKPKSGGGTLRYEAWGRIKNGSNLVTRYNIAYINHAVCSVDHGRVLGYDNAHNYHHRHYMGTVKAVDFVSYEHTLELFQMECAALLKLLKTQGKKL